MDDSVLAAPVRYTNIRPRQHQAPARCVSQCSDEQPALTLLIDSSLIIIIAVVGIIAYQVYYCKCLSTVTLLLPIVVNINVCHPLQVQLPVSCY